MEPAILNRLLEARVKDLAGMRRGNAKEDLEVRSRHLLQSLGLYPSPPRTDLHAQVTGTISREGYRIDKLRYESRPGVLVTAHVYVPDGQGPWPLIVSAHGIGKGKKSSPAAQARGIAFALRGFATLVVDAPGSFGDDLSLDERGHMGAPGEPNLIMGAPWIGQYVWDLVRGVDACLGRPEIQSDKIGVTGEAEGGVAALCALIAEQRIGCAAIFCAAPSMEQKSIESIAQLGIPGIALAGDFADMLAIRQAPVLIGAGSGDSRSDIENVALTAEKLGRHNRNVRFERFECGCDYNRRMREAAAAFFVEHLKGGGHAAYLPELRPLTDGIENPYPSGTVPADDPNLLVTEWQNRPTLTFQDLLKANMAEPYPEPYHVEDRLASWPRYASLPKLPHAVTLGIHDDVSGIMPRTDPSIALPIEFIDWRLAAMAGISVPEFFAQVLHLTLPGKPETWESQALTGDGLSAMIASVKTLIQSAAPETIVTHILAAGPVSSLTAMFLKLYRPSLDIQTTHTWSGWMDLLTAGEPRLIQPLARYMEWPF